MSVGGWGWGREEADWEEDHENPEEGDRKGRKKDRWQS